MSDIQPLPDFLTDMQDEELVFEDAGPVVAEAAPVPRRGRGRKPAAPATLEAAATAATEASPQPGVVVAAPAADGPVDAAPVPVPPGDAAATGAKTHMLLVGITLFALLTSLLSLGGLIAVGRTLARVEAQGQRSEDEHRAFAEAPALVAQLTQAGNRLDAAAQRYAAAAPSGPPASIADIRHELDVLRFGLSQHQPDAVNALGGLTRSGFSELTAKIDQLQAQVAGRRPPSPPAPHR